PGYDSIIGPETATVAEILKENGYATSWFGKEHNTPNFQYTLAGPFDQWPVGMGFQYFYGFMGGETDPWTPYLFKQPTHTFPLFLRAQGRRDRSVAAFPVKRPAANLPVDGQARLQPDDRHGRRGHKIREGPECGCARQAVLPLLRARRHACPAPADARMDREI